MPKLLDWNATRFQIDDPHGHVESYFIKGNSPDGTRAVWLKATIFSSPGRASYALTEAWAIVFRSDGPPVAVKDSRRLGDSHFSSDGFDVRIGELLRMGPDGTQGDIARQGNRIRWDFGWSGDRKPLVMLPYTWMYSGPVPSTKLVSPLPDLELRGTLRVGDEEMSVDGWKAMQGHNWGQRHATPYAWGHCNCWEQDEEFVIEAATGRLSFGPLRLPPKTLVVFRYRGETYSLNAWHHLLRNQGQIHPRRWLVRASHKDVGIEADFTARSDELAGLYYPNPDGKVAYVANSKLAFARVRVYLPGQEPMDLTSKCAAWEFAEDHVPNGVTMLT